MSLDKIQRRMEDPRYKALNITTADDSEPYVFVSYKSDDWEVVLSTIVYELQDRYGLRVYFDRAFDEANALWTEQFQKAMGSPKCKAVVVFLSKHYYASYATLLELMYSQTKICMVNRIRKPIIPVIIDPNLQNEVDKLMSNEEDTGLRLEGTERLLFDRVFDQLVTIAHKENGLDAETLNSYVKQMRLEKRICAQFIEAIINFSKSNYNFFIDNEEFYHKLALTINDAVNTTKNSLQDTIDVFNNLNSIDLKKMFNNAKVAVKDQDSNEIVVVDMNVQQAFKDVTYVISKEELNKLSADDLFNRGWNWNSGNVEDRDYTKAFSYFVHAAYKDVKAASFRIAYAYDEGNGVARDYVKARAWYLKSAEEANDMYAKYNLGIIYEFAKGVEKNLEVAIEWYRKSAEQGFDSAMNKMAQFYDHGKHGIKDDKEAFKWYKKTAEAGKTEAYIEVALGYYQGEVVEQDYEQARIWFEKAGKESIPNANFYLGEIYENGYGVKVDIVKAMSYYTLSSDSNPKARERLLALTGQGIGAIKDKIVESEMFKKVSEIDVDSTIDATKEAMKNIGGKFKGMFKK